MPLPPTKRKPGRPQAEVPGVRITTFVRSPDYDRLLALAKHHETSISGIVRDLLRLRLRPPAGDPRDP